VEKEERAFVFFFSHFQNIKKEGLVVAVFFFLKRPKESQHQQITLHLTHHQSIDQSINRSINPLPTTASSKKTKGEKETHQVEKIGIV